MAKRKLISTMKQFVDVAGLTNCLIHFSQFLFCAYYVIIYSLFSLVCHCVILSNENKVNQQLISQIWLIPDELRIYSAQKGSPLKSEMKLKVKLRNQGIISI